LYSKLQYIKLCETGCQLRKFFTGTDIFHTGAFPALRAGNRAFRSKSSEAPMRFLWAFRSNPIAHGSSEPVPGNCQGQFPGQLIAPGN
jgi:hypothetical protein